MLTDKHTLYTIGLRETLTATGFYEQLGPKQNEHRSFKVSLNDTFL